MTESIHDLIREVDAECRRLSIPMLGPHKAAYLCELIREEQPKIVVEVGTAIGYSGLWIARTLRELGQGILISLELDDERADQAWYYFRRAGVDKIITLLRGDARARIAEAQDPIDFLFLDGGFENYYPCLQACRILLRDPALLVADNAGIGAAEMADYLRHVRHFGESRTEWFDTDLEWNPRDAMEITRYHALQVTSPSLWC